MDTKFTKGEWFVHTMDPTVILIPGGGFDIVDIPDAKANAHLIASAPDMYRMIDFLHKELMSAISEVNMHRAKEINSQTETEPDYWDAQTCYEAQLLLKKARGE